MIAWLAIAISAVSIVVSTASVVQSYCKGWINRHDWVPFLYGTDGLTGRERRAMADRYARTIGSPR